MDFLTVINWIYIGICCVTFLLGVLILILAFVQRRRCSDFPTLLACNTIVGAVIFSGNALSIAVYMYVWDQYATPDFFSLCSIRAYIHHSAIASVHHSLVLQALQKYCSITRLRLLDSTTRKVCMVICQWIFDFTFVLPVLLTGNIVKLSVEGVCLVAFSRPELLFSIGGIIFFLSDVIMMYIYGNLVIFVRKASTKMNGAQKLKLNRDMAVMRRIMILHCALLFLVLPALVAMILGAIRIEILPYRLFRVFCLVTSVSVLFMILVLFWITPKLQKLVSSPVSRTSLAQTIITIRIAPVTAD